MSRMLLCVAAVGCAAAFACPAPAQVRINEILGDPSVDWNNDGVVHFRDDEWVEVVNVGTELAEMDCYRLSDAAGVFRYGFTGTLEPGQTQVVYGSHSVAWETAAGASTVGLSLNNAGDTVILWEVTDTDTFAVDQYTYAGHEVLDDRSTARVPDGIGEWTLFDALSPYTGSGPPNATGCPPTPGESNECPTAVESASWTGVKTRFRPMPGPRP